MIEAAIFACAAVLVGAVSVFARAEWIRASAYCALVIGIGAIWFASLGRPKPAWLAPRSGEVVAFSLDEPHAIYVWIKRSGSREPVSITFPWREQRAAELIAATRKAKRSGDEVRMGSAQRAQSGRRGASASGKERSMFYPAPPAALPVKTAH